MLTPPQLELPGGDHPSLISPPARAPAAVAPAAVTAQLFVYKTGSGSGRVVSSPAGIDCGASCPSQAAQFPVGTEVTLRAYPNGGSALWYWLASPDCPGPGACVVTIPDGGRSVEASFELTQSGASELLSAPGARGASDDIVSCAPRPCMEPSDSSIGVSSSEFVQASNAGIRISRRETTLRTNQPLWDFDLAYFFAAPADERFDADPRVAWDPLSQRWFLTAVGASCDEGRIFIAVSDGAVLADGWTSYMFTAPASFADFDTLGISSNKVAVGANFYPLANCVIGGSFLGASLLIVDKADLMAGAVNWYEHAPAGLATYQPARNQTGGNPLHVVVEVVNGLDLDVGYLAIDGLPAQNGSGGIGTLTIPSVTDLSTTTGLSVASGSLLPFVDPPAPAQPGNPSTITDVIDGRPLDALWANNRLTFVSTTACIPSGGTATRSCARITELGTSPSIDVLQDFTIGRAGFDTFAPGVGLAPTAFGIRYPLVVTFAQSSSTEPISIYGSFQHETDLRDRTGSSVLLIAGEGSYAGSRWGDYHQLGTDPVANGQLRSVWHANQYPDGSGGWSTWVSQLAGYAQVPMGGSLQIAAGRSSTIYRQVGLRTIPANEIWTGTANQETQVLVSNSPTTSGGVLQDARQLPLAAAAPWVLDDPAFGGTSSTGAKTVYLQFGDGSGGWSSVVSDAITLVDGGVQRLAGADRYATAAVSSAATFDPGLPTVFISSGLNFPDALAGGPVAGRIQAPILLVGTSAPSSTKSEITRLQPAQLVVLGGTGVVSNAVVGQIGFGGPVYRIAGANRYATAAAISATYFRPDQPRVYVANGLNFPDALAGAAAAAHLDAPLILVSPTSLPAETAAELTRLNPGEVIVLGGTGSVSDTVKNAVATNCGCPVTRIGGANRYATAALVAHEAWTGRPGFDDVEVSFIATGAGFPDALSGAAAAGLHGGPLLLVNANGIPAETATELVLLGSDRIVILGGTGVVPPTVAVGLLAYADEP